MKNLCSPARSNSTSHYLRKGLHFFSVLAKYESNKNTDGLVTQGLDTEFSGVK